MSVILLEEIILERLREEPPDYCTIVEKSLPIIAFGRFMNSKVATISLNPSYAEFEKVKGHNRFHTLDTLGIEKYSDINEVHVKSILEYCETYFERSYSTGVRKIKKHPIYYSRWFNPMELIINKINGSSYLDGSACHLDISQWATKTIWGDLNQSQKKALIGAKDLELIRELIKNNNYEMLLLNGATTSKYVLKNIFLIDNYNTFILSTSPKVEVYYKETNHLLGIKTKKPIKLFGWNDYIQRKPKNINLIVNWIREKLKDNQ